MESNRHTISTMVKCLISPRMQRPRAKRPTLLCEATTRGAVPRLAHHFIDML
jgi:hypothetical protein